MSTTLEEYAVRLARNARAAERKLALTSGKQRNEALRAMATAMREQTDALVAENAKDLAAAQANGLTSAMIDRLKLDPGRVAKMAQAVLEIAKQQGSLGPEVCPEHARRPVNPSDLRRPLP